MAGPRLQFAEPDGAKAILALYDRKIDTWGFPLEGDFWDAVHEAHRRGLTGQGRRIAIIDSAVDLTIPRLARASGGAALMHAPAGEKHDHGSVVALLALTAAPDAALDLYEATRDNIPDYHAVRAALGMAAASGADAVCMSLGVDIPKDDVTVTPDISLAGGLAASLGRVLAAGGRQTVAVAACPAGAVCMCAASQPVSAKGKMVFAAVGNLFALFCPAIAPGVTAVGFQTEVREARPEGGETSMGWVPGFDQSAYSDFTLNQPPGVLGSSYAAPLIAGASALGLEDGDIDAFVASARLCAQADLIHTLYGYRDIPDEFGALATSLYSAALNAQPHLDRLADGEHWCIGCALFSTPLMINSGLSAYADGRFDAAEPRLRVGRRLAPQNPNGAANLGRLLLTRAQIAGAGPETRALLEESVALYDQAIALRPGYDEYVTTRGEAAALLAALS